MNFCPKCNSELTLDSRGRQRKFCSLKCSITFHRFCIPRKTKKCLYCQSCFVGRKERKFCSRSCKAKHLWDNGTCKVPQEIALKNLINFPDEGKSTLYPSNRYKRIHINGIRITEHRKVMEDHLGRKLNRDEVVHHKNEDPTDNRLENLQLVTKVEHGRIHKKRKELA